MPSYKAIAARDPLRKLIVEARREATCKSRIAQAVEWIAQGRTRNRKCQGC